MRSRVLRMVGASVVVAGVVAVFAAGGSDDDPWVGPARAQAATLQSFGDCDAVLGYFHDRAPEVLIERAGGGRRVFARAMPAMAEDTAASGAGGGETQHSTTNVQEAGVDEPDLVKTDGARIVAVAQEHVHLVAADRGEMTLRKTLPEGNVRNVFLAGDRLLLFSGPPAEEVEPGWGGGGQQATLTLYDVADFATPRRVASLTIDGDVLDARLVGTQVRVATSATPDMDTPSRDRTRDGRPSWRWKEAIRDAVARTTVDDWLPAYTLRDGKGTQLGTGRLAECADLARPEHFSGLDTVAVTTFDLGSALQDRASVGVVAGGQRIYATDTSTYVATTEWDPDDAATATSLHKFVTQGSGTTAYRGSGEVPGRLLNSYALSEHDGVLRVASTVSGSRGRTDGWGTTEGMVTTLREQDGELRRLGQVDGLGREDNESIMAVRFIEDRGYVVTFRQTDPLYVLDLADPAAPRTVGELKIPGYSGYLHPLGGNRLLGVGQSGAGGVQFSLFDTADPADPRRIDTQSYGSGAAGAEFDPRAFLYWEPRRLVVAPLTVYGSHRGRGPFSGLVMLEAGADGLTEVDRLATMSSEDMAQRSVVIGDAVYLLSDRGLQSRHLDTRRDIDRLSF